jgi:hypothetical protein
MPCLCASNLDNLFGGHTELPIQPSLQPILGVGGCPTPLDFILKSSNRDFRFHWLGIHCRIAAMLADSSLDVLMGGLSCLFSRKICWPWTSSEYSAWLRQVPVYSATHHADVLAMDCSNKGHNLLPGVLHLVSRTPRP